MIDIFTLTMFVKLITIKVIFGILHKTGRKNFHLFIKLWLWWIPFCVNSIPTAKNQKRIFFCHTSSSPIIFCPFGKIRISLQIGPFFSCAIEHFQIRCITPPLTFVIEVVLEYVFASSNHYWLPMVQRHISGIIVIPISRRTCIFPAFTIEAED